MGLVETRKSWKSPVLDFLSVEEWELCTPERRDSSELVVSDDVMVC